MRRRPPQVIVTRAPTASRFDLAAFKAEPDEMARLFRPVVQVHERFILIEHQGVEIARRYRGRRRPVPDRGATARTARRPGSRRRSSGRPARRSRVAAASSRGFVACRPGHDRWSRAGRANRRCSRPERRRRNPSSGRLGACSPIDRGVVDEEPVPEVPKEGR